LRRLRYALNITDLRVLELFALAGREMTRAELDPYFLKEEEPGFVDCPDEVLGAFLEGLVVSKRGRREEGGDSAAARPKPPERLSNNEILKRLRIALELRDEDLVAIMQLAGAKVSKSELSAFFRKFGQPNWRPCGDQFLRNFLTGLTAKYRV
jgi:uncharacterized protein YehS (DUF1456 family)